MHCQSYRNNPNVRCMVKSNLCFLRNAHLHSRHPLQIVCVTKAVMKVCGSYWACLFTMTTLPALPNILKRIVLHHSVQIHGLESQPGHQTVLDLQA